MDPNVGPVPRRPGAVSNTTLVRLHLQMHSIDVLPHLGRTPELVAAVIAHELLSEVVRLVDLLMIVQRIVIATGVVALITLVPLLVVEVNHIPVIFEIGVILSLESALGTNQFCSLLSGHMPRALVLGHLVSSIGCV